MALRVVAAAPDCQLHVQIQRECSVLNSDASAEVLRRAFRNAAARKLEICPVYSTVEKLNSGVIVTLEKMPLDPRPLDRKYAVIVPTWNAERHWPRFLPALLACAPPERVVVVDSESTDRTPELARSAGFRVLSCPQREFNHGGTRQWAIQFTGDAEILVFMTQDAILAGPHALERLLAAFDDPEIAASYGRQLARPGAGAIEAHGRLFNYPSEGNLRSLSSRETMGFKAIFLSNSFAAYRRIALDAVGGFPTNVILGEDTITAANLLLKGWKIRYVADAEVYHSHDYSAWQEFQRYFDTGVLHSRESWLRETFGKTGDEGKRFLRSELAYLWKTRPSAIPSALMRTAAKLTGYRLGRIENKIAVPLKVRLSMHSDFWKSAP